MRVVVTGPTGNVGTSVVSALAADPNVTTSSGSPGARPTRTRRRREFLAADVTRAPLVDLFDGADAVVHLAWLVQPSRDATALKAVNVHGSRLVSRRPRRRRLRARPCVVGRRLGPGPASGEQIDESWPTDGIPSSFYTRHEAQAERALDAIEATAPRLRVVQASPGAGLGARGEQARSGRCSPARCLPGRLARPRL